MDDCEVAVIDIETEAEDGGAHDGLVVADGGDMGSPAAVGAAAAVVEQPGGDVAPAPSPPVTMTARKRARSKLWTIARTKQLITQGLLCRLCACRVLHPRWRGRVGRVACSVRGVPASMAEVALGRPAHSDGARYQAAGAEARNCWVVLEARV